MIYGLDGEEPEIHGKAFVFESATVIGDVTLQEEASVWPSATLRGDSNGIVVGERTNIQDNAVIHVDAEHPTTVGNDVTIGHSAVVHGCTIGDTVLIGMGATVLSGAEIGENCIVAAGAVVPEGMEVPAGSLVMGIPASRKRELSEDDRRMIVENAAGYVAKAERYKSDLERVR